MAEPKARTSPLKFSDADAVRVVAAAASAAAKLSLHATKRMQLSRSELDDLVAQLLALLELITEMEGR